MPLPSIKLALSDVVRFLDKNKQVIKTGKIKFLTSTNKIIRFHPGIVFDGTAIHATSNINFTADNNQRKMSPIYELTQSGGVNSGIVVTPKVLLISQSIYTVGVQKLAFDVIRYYNKDIFHLDRTSEQYVHFLSQQLDIALPELKNHPDIKVEIMTNLHNQEFVDMISTINHNDLV